MQHDGIAGIDLEDAGTAAAINGDASGQGRGVDGEVFIESDLGAVEDDRLAGESGGKNNHIARA